MDKRAPAKCLLIFVVLFLLCVFNKYWQKILTKSHILEYSNSIFWVRLRLHRRGPTSASSLSVSLAVLQFSSPAFFDFFIRFQTFCVVLLHAERRRDWISSGWRRRSKETERACQQRSKRRFKPAGSGRYCAGWGRSGANQRWPRIQCRSRLDRILLFIRIRSQSQKFGKTGPGVTLLSAIAGVCVVFINVIA